MKRLFSILVFAVWCSLLTIMAQSCTTVSFADAYARFYNEQTGVGTPYVASTLEPSELPADPDLFVEPLIVNFEGVDCTTYVEYVTAARIAGVSAISAADSTFLSALQTLRYRGGRRGNYATRKHYFSEWISDAEAMGLVKDVTPAMTASEPLKKKIDFMSRNPQFYPQLQKSEKILNEVKKVEQQLSDATVQYIQKARIAEAYQEMQHGDIVVFLTNKQGLDVQHVGFVWKPTAKDTPRLMHASTTHKQVTVDKRTISQYAEAQKSITGIRIVRIK